MKRKLKELVLGAKCLVLGALCAVGLSASALPPSPYRDIWSSTPDPQAIKDPANVIDWGMASRTFESSEAKHGKFLEASADEMIAAYTARIEKDPTDCEALICRAFAYAKKAGENEAFDRIAQEFGYTFDNDTMHFTGELIHEKGATPEMNDATAEVCDILLPLMKKAFKDLSAVPDRWKGSVAITPDVYPVDESVYFDWADVLCAKTALAEMMCVLNMVKGFDVTMDSDLLEYTFNSRSPKNGKRGVQPILENNPDFFSKVRDQKAATEAGDWWASAATLLDQWDKAHAKRSDGKQHFFDWNFEKMDDNTVACYDWLHKHRDGLINLPYWASPFDYTLMNGDTAQFWTLQPLFAGKFLRKHFPEFGVGVKEPWCNEPLLDTLPDSTLCGIYPGVSRKFIGDLMTDNKRAGDFTTIPPYTDDSASSVHNIWYDNLFELGFDNTGNQSIFAWDTASPITLLDPTFNVRGVTAVFTGWSFSGYPNGSKATWEGSEIPTPYTKESPMYKRRNVVATANFDIPQVTYLDFEGGKLAERTDECELVKAETTTFEAGKVYTVLGNVTIEKRITVSGTSANPTKLVLCDGATLMAANGVDVAAGKALTICGQALGTGTLEATGEQSCAAIGGGSGVGGGTVTINGGTVIATGGSSAAGIGGGGMGAGGVVTINGGTVTATSGGSSVAGIGAGFYGSSPGTVKFAEGTAYGVAAGAAETNAIYKTAAAYAADHSAIYVAFPYVSLKIPAAEAGYSYEVSSMGVHPTAVLADQTNTYAIAAGATARVLFTPGEDYVWVKAPVDNPMIIANLSGDTVIDAADLPTTRFVKKGSEENPWAVGYSTRDSVAAWTNGTDKLVVEGAGNMKDFTEGNPAPWGTGIASAEIGEDVTGIGARAFADSQLGSVTIPASVTSIGAAAFFGSTSLSNVVVEAMTPPALGEGAFVELAEGYKIIVPVGTSAAYKAAPDWSLYADSIVEPGSPEYPWEVGKTAGDSVIAYIDGEGKLVIEGEGNMKDFDPPSDPAPWGTGVAEVEIGEDVTGIGAKAFAGCASLSNVVINAMTPPTLGADAFTNPAEGFKIAVPKGTSAAYKAAPGWSDFAANIFEQGTPECPWQVGSPNAADVTAYTDGEGKLVIGGTGDMRDFDPPGDPAPWGTGITEVEIGEDVTGIGARAFNDSQLGSATIPASVTNIGAAAFFCSTSLSNVVVEAMTPPALGEGAFVELAEGYKIFVPMGTGAAYRAAPDWSLYADSIVEQGSPECPWQVGSPNAADVIAYGNGEGKLVVEGEGDMRDFDPSSDPAPWVTGVSEAEIGEGVTSIGANAFNDSQLGSVTIPASVTNIGAAAFFCSTSLSNVVVEAKTPPALGEGAFVELAEGFKIAVPMGTSAAYKAAPDWSLYADSIVEQGTPENPWKVGDGVTAYIDESGTLHVDGEGAMTDFSDDFPAPWSTAGIPVTSAEIGEGVTGIGTNAFKDCASLTNVTVLATVPPSLGGGAFSGCDSLAKIYVPRDTGDDYRASSGWSEYAEKILEMPGSAENPWTVGPEDDPDGVVAWTDGNGNVYFKPPRGTVSRTGLETITNAMGGASFPVWLVSEDGSTTNDLVMVIGASGARYDSLAEALEAGEDSYKLYDVEGCVVNYDGMGAMGEMPSDTFLPGIPTNLAANAYTAFGYTFQGWTTNFGSEVIFADRALIANPQAGDVYDLQAVWKYAPVSVGDGVGAYLDAHGALHIVGAGAMKDFTEADPAPWAGFAPDIKAIEVAEGVTKVGNAAFAALDYETTTTALTFMNEDAALNLLAFVSADGSVTNAPAAAALRAFRSESGTVEPIVAFYVEEIDVVSKTVLPLLRVGYTEAALWTLDEFKAVQAAELVETAGETPYSKAMQGLLDEALDKLDKATNYDEVMDGYDVRLKQIQGQAAKDKTNEIEGSDITWRFMDGTVVIDGEGEMPDFVTPDFPDGAPWNKMKDDITNATVAAGITSVGDAAFAVCPSVEGASVLFKDPALELNLGAFVSGDKSVTNVPTVKVEIVTVDEKGEHKLRVVPGGWTDADKPNATYDSIAEALENGAASVKAAFEKKTDEGEKAVLPAEVEETVTKVDPETGKEIELTAKYENRPTADGSTVGLVTEVENLPLIVDNTGSNIVITVTATNKMDKMVTKEGSDVVKEMDGAMSNDCEIVKAMLAPDVATENFDSSYLDMSAFFNFKNDSGRLVEFTKSIIAHIPMKLYDGQIYSVSRRHEGVAEVLPLWFEGIDDSDTAEWVKVDVANQELVVKTRKFCDYALGTLELEKSCVVTVGDSGKKFNETDPKSIATNFQVRVTGELNVPDFGGYCKRAQGEVTGGYAINFICTRIPDGFPAGAFTVIPGIFTIGEPEMIDGDGTVYYPTAQKNGLLREKTVATWRATAAKGCVFTGWTAAAGAPASVTNHLAAFSANERRKTPFSFKVEAGEQIAPTDIAATWARIDEDAITGVMLVTNAAGMLVGLDVETLSYVTATVSGLPGWHMFDAKALKVTERTNVTRRDAKTYTVRVSVRNASGYTWKQDFAVTFAAGTGAVTSIEPVADEDAHSVPVMIYGNPAAGRVNGTGVYALTLDRKTGVWSRRVSVSASANPNYVFAGWYLDPGFSMPASFTTGGAANGRPRDYREMSQTVMVTCPTYLFARFVEKTTKADPITWLRYEGAGYCGADASWLAEEETWYQGVALPTNGCAVAFGSASLPTVTVSGLPAGVKFDKATFRFTGVPTACSTARKPFFTVKISVRNKSGATDVLVKNVYVEPLPTWTAGNFDGYHMEKGVTNGTFQATVGSTGRVSGKTAGGLAPTTFSANSFSGVELVKGELCYIADVTVSYRDPLKKKTVKRVDTLYLMENPETGLGMIGGGDKDDCGVVGVQCAWSRKDLAYLYRPFATGQNAPTLDLGNGITLKFGSNGKVSFAGKVTDDNGKLITVSGTTYVLPFAWQSEACLRTQVYVYVAPKTNFADGVSEVYDVYLTTGADGKFDAASFTPPGPDFFELAAL